MSSMAMSQTLKPIPGTVPLHVAEFLQCHGENGAYAELVRVRVPGGWVYLNYPSQTVMVFVCDD